MQKRFAFALTALVAAAGLSFTSPSALPAGEYVTIKITNTCKKTVTFGESQTATGSTSTSKSLSAGALNTFQVHKGWFIKFYAADNGGYQTLGKADFDGQPFSSNCK